MPANFHVDLTSLPRPAQAAAAAVVLVLLLSAVLLRSGRDNADVANAQAVQAAVAPAAVAAAPTEADAVRAANVPVEGLTVELKASGPCWVSASADRSPVLSRLLQAGDAETVEARDEFVLRVGDPATIALTINGQPVRSLGRAGMPVTVQINRDNLRDFVAAPN
jgi:hypothetical protein